MKRLMLAAIIALFWLPLPAFADQVFVHISNGVVDNAAVFSDSGLPANWPDHDNWLPANGAQIGWTCSAGTCTAPPVPPAPPPSTNPADYPLQRYQFEAMLTIAGLSNLPAQAIATISDPTARIVAQAKYDAATTFYWNDPTTAAMIAAAVASGALTQQQAAAYWLQAKSL